MTECLGSLVIKISDLQFFIAFWLFYFFVWFRLYFAKLRIGSPPKDYFVQVDTGSDILWVNCVECQKCPTKSDLGVGVFTRTISCIIAYCSPSQY